MSIAAQWYSASHSQAIDTCGHECRWLPGLASQWASCRRSSRAGMSSMTRVPLLPGPPSAACATSLCGAPTSSC